MEKSMKQKLSEIVKVTMATFFYFDEICKKKHLWLKNCKQS